MCDLCVLFSGMQAPVTSLAWAPHSSSHICTAGDDAQALIWDLSNVASQNTAGLDPILAYCAEAEVNQLEWSALQTDWIAIGFANKCQVLRV